jgi:hypothetical protein
MAAAKKPNPQRVADLEPTDRKAEREQVQPSNTDDAINLLMTAPPEDPVELFETLGEALHGAHWIGPVARDLGNKRSTVAAWVSGKSRFPGRPVLDQMWLLVKSHHKAVAKARALAPGKKKT